MECGWNAELPGVGVGGVVGVWRISGYWGESWDC